MIITRHPSGARDGFALPVALFAMVVIGAIMTGGFYVSAQEDRISASSALGAQAMYMAEYGIEETLGTWKVADVASAGSGTTSKEVWSGNSRLGRYEVSVRQLATQLYLLQSTGYADAGPKTAERTLATVIRTATATLPYMSAMTIFGKLEATGNSLITGSDECTTDEVAGVTAVSDTLVNEGNKDRIQGAPDVEEAAGMTADSLSEFGHVSLDDLRKVASKVYEVPDSVEQHMEPYVKELASGEKICDEPVKKNWGGDPDGTMPECVDYYPTIWAKGDLRLDGGTGQGILIVDGDLRLTGNVKFSGVVIVGGTLYADGTANEIRGSVLVQGDGEIDETSTTTGNSLVQYNSCEIENAFNNNLRPRTLAYRSWMDLTAVVRPQL